MALGLQAETGIDQPPNERLLDESVVQLAYRHRLEGFLRRHSNVLAVRQEPLEANDATSLERAQQALSQWAASISLSRLLGESGIHHLIFKGIALTLQTSAENDLRGGGDVDVLVLPEDVSKTHALLIAHEYIPVYAMGPRTKLGWKFLTYRNREMPYRSPQIEVDLHWRIATEADLLPPTAKLLGRAEKVGHSGQEFLTLSPTDALAACAVHFFLDYGVALRRLVDFVRLARISDPTQLVALPSRSQQLVADLAEFCRELFGNKLVHLAGLKPPRPENVTYLRELFWSGNGGYAHTRGEGSGWHRLLRNYRHLGRYSNKFFLSLRLVARGLVWFPETTPQQVPIGLWRAFGRQVTRVLQGKFDSQV